MANPSTAFINDESNYADHDAFLADDFDPNTYADTIVSQTDGQDAAHVQAALARMSASIDTLNKQIQTEVVGNYEALLNQVRGTRELEVVLSTVQNNVTELSISLKSLGAKIRDPYNQLQTYTTQLENMQETTDLLRRLHRFVILTRRLDSQLPNRDSQNSSERDIVSAALTLHELESILGQEPIFAEIDLVTAELPYIEKARSLVDAEAERLLNEGINGINGLNQTKIAAGLQIYYNVKTMGTRVEKLINSILDEITQEIKHVVDMQSLQKQVRGTSASTGPAVRRANHEPTLGNQSAWTQAIWSRMESFGSKMSQSCIKVYELEKVLEVKKDPLTQVSFLEEVLKTLDATSLVSRFWRLLAVNFEKELKEATRASSFLRNTFVGEFPKLQRFLQDSLTRVAIHNGVSPQEFSQSPEYVIMQRSISAFEHSYRNKRLQQ
ncbi:Golgi transport complex subunit 5-domain-containing protein [Syncephalastrum racemosum]|uniref:Conserved oligomeric Golgi complex subunit 5 n=1 Tax=Syncephalastrum racemosum TaxID=13706 RepID=A0A1X2HGB5_SYNRA|nr:Golgi transport complex subunit 5-domain-containing protein [Syncephalastrum racemosum]